MEHLLLQAAVAQLIQQHLTAEYADKERINVALRDLGPAALPTLEEILARDDPRERLAAICAIALMGRPHAVPILLRALLKRCDEAEVFSALALVCDERAIPVALAWLEDENCRGKVAATAANCLAQCCNEQCSWTLEALTDLVGRRPQERAPLLVALSQTRDLAAMPTLLEYVGDADRLTRARAVEGLRLMPSREAVEVLCQVVRAGRTSRHLRLNAFSSLFAHPWGTPEDRRDHAPYLAELGGVTGAPFLFAACLNQVMRDPLCADIVRAFARSADARFRLDILEATENDNDLPGPRVDHLRAIMQSPHVHLRKRAAACACTIDGLPDDDLWRIARDPDRRVRTALARSCMLATADPRMHEVLRWLSQSSEV